MSEETKKCYHCNEYQLLDGWHGRYCRICWNKRLRATRRNTRSDGEVHECFCCQGRTKFLICGFCIKCRNTFKVVDYGNEFINKVQQYVLKSGKPKRLT